VADDPHVQNHVKDDKKSKETKLQIPGQETPDLEILIQELDTKSSNFLGRTILAIILIQFVMVFFADLDEGFFVFCLFLYGFVFLITKGTGSVFLFLMWCIIILIFLTVLASIAGVWGAPF
tara:strand:+ start:155 stop:517 length:363 start_codon:yes stop_codon:yes gene_type:complete